MPAWRGGRGPRGTPAAAGVVILATLTACHGAEPPADRTAAVAAAVGSPQQVPATAVGRYRSIRELPVAARPVRVAIAAIGVDAPVVALGKAADGSLSVPRRWGDVGWYSGGPLPGEFGPAVLLGHVDSRSGPAVFYRLATLRAGAIVAVRAADGRLARFRVSRVARYAKQQFPTEAVYLPTLDPVLQLITCGGRFDRRTGHYRDNYVVTAALQR